MEVVEDENRAVGCERRIAEVDGANSGSCSRPAATRCDRKPTQSRSSSSMRYQRVRSRVRREKSARSVVFP
jgi:hypothetical protein